MPATEVSASSIFMTESQIADEAKKNRRPAVAPFVGRVTRVAGKQLTYDDAVRNMLSVTVEPLNAVAAYGFGCTEGVHQFDVRVPTQGKVRNTNSIYKIWLNALNKALSDTAGMPGYTIKSPDEMVNTVLLWGEVAPEDPMFKSLGNYGPRDYVFVALGPAPEGWEKTIPADLAEKKAAAIAAAKQRAADRAAGESSQGSSSSSTQGQTVTNTVTTPDFTDEDLKVLAGFLNGRPMDDTVMIAVMSDSSLRTHFGARLQSVIFGLGGDRPLLGLLTAKNLITKGADGVLKA